MSDQEIASRVARLAAELNAGLRDAVDAGLRVDVQLVDVTEIQMRSRLEYVSVEVSRPLT